MSRRNLKILITIFFILVFGSLLFGWMIVKNQNPTSVQDTPSSGFLGTFYSLFSRPNQNEGEDGSGNGGSTATSSGSMVGGVPRMRQITDKPVAGSVFIERNVSSTTVDSTGLVKNVTVPVSFIRYVERATSHIFETRVDSRVVNEISNTTLPKIYDALFTNKGDSVILRYLSEDNNTIKTTYGSLASSTQTLNTTTLEVSTKVSSLIITDLPSNINEMTLSPTRDQIFYVGASNSGGVGTTSLPNGSKPRKLFTSSLSEWLINWPKSNTITLTTKPSAQIPGYLFYLNSTNGTLTKILGNIPGLTVLASPDLNSILFSETNSINFDLNVYTPKNDTASILSLKTLPEKCVWSQKSSGLIYCAVPLIVAPGVYPDSWYKGSVSFADNFWKINLKTGAREMIGKTSDYTKNGIDAVKLSLDPSENNLMFVNKKDLTLWNLIIATSTPSV